MLSKSGAMPNAGDGRAGREMRSVTVIPASLNKYSDIPLATTAKRKVAAYARVSTDDEDQQTSYVAQCDY